MRVQRLTRLMAVAAMAATAIIVWAPAAGAHPRLLTADPKPSTVAPGPLHKITVRFDEAVQWQYSTIDVEDTEGPFRPGPARPSPPRRAAISPRRPGQAGRCGSPGGSWAIDAHPVIGAYVFGIVTRPARRRRRARQRPSASWPDPRRGPHRLQGLNWAIRGGRSLEIILLYLVLGILLLRVFVLRDESRPHPGPRGGHGRRPANPTAATADADARHRRRRRHAVPVRALRRPARLGGRQRGLATSCSPRSARRGRSRRSCGSASPAPASTGCAPGGPGVSPG